MKVPIYDHAAMDYIVSVFATVTGRETDPDFKDYLYEILPSPTSMESVDLKEIWVKVQEWESKQ